MSDGDVAVFRRFQAAWSEGDLETALSLVEPDVVAEPLHGALYSRQEYRGRDGIAEWHREMTEPSDRFETIVEDAVATPEGVIGVLRLVAHRGDERLHARVGAVFELRDGRIARLRPRNASAAERDIARARGEPE